MSIYDDEAEQLVAAFDIPLATIISGKASDLPGWMRVNPSQPDGFGAEYRGPSGAIYTIYPHREDRDAAPGYFVLVRSPFGEDKVDIVYKPEDVKTLTSLIEGSQNQRPAESHVTAEMLDSLVQLMEADTDLPRILGQRTPSNALYTGALRMAGLVLNLPEDQLHEKVKRTYWKKHPRS